MFSLIPYAMFLLSVAVSMGLVFYSMSLKMKVDTLRERVEIYSKELGKCRVELENLSKSCTERVKELEKEVEKQKKICSELLERRERLRNKLKEIEEL